MKISVQILKLDYRVRIIPVSVKKKQGSFKKWLVLGLAKEVSKRSLRYLVLLKTKKAIKDSYVKDQLYSYVKDSIKKPT